MENGPIPRGELIRKVAVAGLTIFVLMAAMFFIPAGTFAYWEAWVYLAVLFIPGTFVIIYLFKRDPELLERRLRFGEREPGQRKIMSLSYLWLLITFTLPGFDKRFGWSDVPTTLVIAADVIVLLGYGLVFLTFKENPYASRIVEVEEGQKVITTGPYGIVRHPMYLGALLLYIASPVALGSYWALIPAVLIIPILVARILNEESVLLAKLRGYGEYMLQTKYRLLPGIW